MRGPEIDTSALIIVDMQNDFVHPEGGFAHRAREASEKGIDMPFLMGTIPAVQRLADAFRTAGRPVVSLAHMVKPDYSDAQFPYGRLGLQPGGRPPVHCRGHLGGADHRRAATPGASTWSSRKASGDSRTRRSTRSCAPWA